MSSSSSNPPRLKLAMTRINSFSQSFVFVKREMFKRDLLCFRSLCFAIFGPEGKRWFIVYTAMSSFVLTGMGEDSFLNLLQS